MENLLTGMQKPTFDEFSKKRLFQDFGPKSFGGGKKLKIDVEKSTSFILNQSITSNTTAQISGGKPHIVTPFDLPRFDNLDTDNKKISWINTFLGVDLATSESVDAMNHLLNWGLYNYNWTYHSNVPTQLKNLRFTTQKDIFDFLHMANSGSQIAVVYMQILKCMMASGMIIQSPQLSKVGHHMKQFTTKHVQPHFTYDENGNGQFVVNTGENQMRNINFSVYARNKSHSSSVKKLIAQPKVSIEDVWNDMLGFEFEVESKDDVIFLIDYLFQKIIMKNYTLSESEVNDQYSLIKALKDNWGFDIRQKGMLSKEDINRFFMHHQNHGLHPIIESMLKAGDIRDERKPLSGDNFSDLKFQGLFQFNGDGYQTIEMRIILNNNTNNDGFEHETIRDGLRTMIGKDRLQKYVTTGYVGRLAGIFFNSLSESDDFNSTHSGEASEIERYYKDKMVDFVLGETQRKVNGLLTMKGSNENLDANGIFIVGIR